VIEEDAFNCIQVNPFAIGTCSSGLAFVTGWGRVGYIIAVGQHCCVVVNRCMMHNGDLMKKEAFG